MGDTLPWRVHPGPRVVSGAYRYSGLLVACLVALIPGCGTAPAVSLSAPPNLSPAPYHSHAPLPTPTVLSIFSFEDRTQLAELAWLRTGLVDMLIAELANNPSLIIVQRERVDEIIREQAFQLSGRVTDESTVKIGRLIGANVFITGRMSVVEGVLRLDAQLVGVEQGTILRAVAAEGSVQDVASVARLLVGKLCALFPPSATNGPAQAGVEMLRTAKATHDGEQLSREGKLFEALTEYERALALNPDNAVIQGRVAHTLERLPPETWLKAGQSPSEQHGLTRIMERLALGLETEIGPPSIDAAGASRNGLVVPVRIRLSRAVLDQVLQAFTQIGGVASPRSEEEDTVAVSFVDHPEWVGALLRDKMLARRLYLRLLSAEGRTLSVYSDFRTWSLSNWVAIDGSTIRIRHAYVLLSEARFGGLTPEQVTAIASVRVTLDRVIQERATVRLDVQTVNDQPNANDPGAPSLESRSKRHQRANEQDALMLDGVSPLRAFMEGAWSPPVTARPWSRGYLPSNDRSATVTLTLDHATQRIREEPRLVRLSGDAEFDQAALAAARTGLQRWLSARGYEALLSSPAVSKEGAGRTAVPVRPLKVRAHFQLHQEVPALNLIGPQALDHPLLPLHSRPRTP